MRTITVTSHGETRTYTELDIQVLVVREFFQKHGVDPTPIDPAFFRYHITQGMTPERILAIAGSTARSQVA